MSVISIPMIVKNEVHNLTSSLYYMYNNNNKHNLIIYVYTINNNCMVFNITVDGDGY